MPQIAAEINATLDPQPARFFAGDSVGLRFAHDTNLDQTVRVDSNGNASFLLIGTLNVAGKRPDEVRAELERAYSAKLTAPDLSVNLLEFIPTADVNSTNRAIHVLGEVRNPGQISFMGQRVTLIDALAKTGGFLKATALLQNVLLVRWMPEQHCYRAWRIDASTKLWGAADQILLQSNDIVFVPNTPIDDVDIWVDQYIRLLIPFPFLLAPAPR
jgi:polysaccharide export outer membrane protein